MKKSLDNVKNYSVALHRAEGEYEKELMGGGGTNTSINLRDNTE